MRRSSNWYLNQEEKNAKEDPENSQNISYENSSNTPYTVYWSIVGIIFFIFAIIQSPDMGLFWGSVFALIICLPIAFILYIPYCSIVNSINFKMKTKTENPSKSMENKGFDEQNMETKKEVECSIKKEDKANFSNIKQSANKPWWRITYNNSNTPETDELNFFDMEKYTQESKIQEKKDDDAWMSIQFILISVIIFCVVGLFLYLFNSDGYLPAVFYQVIFILFDAAIILFVLFILTKRKQKKREIAFLKDGIQGIRMLDKKYANLLEPFAKTTDRIYGFSFLSNQETIYIPFKKGSIPLKIAKWDGMNLGKKNVKEKKIIQDFFDEMKKLIQKDLSLSKTELNNVVYLLWRNRMIQYYHDCYAKEHGNMRWMDYLSFDKSDRGLMLCTCFYVYETDIFLSLRKTATELFEKNKNLNRIDAETSKANQTKDKDFSPSYTPCCIKTEEGLLSYEILMLSHATEYKTEGNQFENIWKKQYGIENPQTVLDKLIKEQYIEPEKDLYCVLQNESIETLKDFLLKNNLSIIEIKEEMIFHILKNIKPNMIEKNFPIRYYIRTEKGEQILANHNYIVYAESISENIETVCEKIISSDLPHQEAVRIFYETKANEHLKALEFEAYCQTKFFLCEFYFGQKAYRKALSNLCEIIFYRINGLKDGDMISKNINLSMGSKMRFLKENFPYSEQSFFRIPCSWISLFNELKDKMGLSELKQKEFLMGEFSQIYLSFCIVDIETACEIVFCQIKNETKKLVRIYNQAKKKLEP